MSRLKKYAVIILAFGAVLFGMLYFNSCILGDGLCVDYKGDFDCTSPLCAEHPLCDKTNPECACFVCDPANPDHPCYCDIEDPEHYLNPDSSCFCNPTIPGLWCADTCMIDTCPEPDEFCFKNSCLDTVEEKCTPEQKTDPDDTCFVKPECKTDYEADVQQVFDTYCTTCHTKGTSYWVKTCAPQGKGLTLKADQQGYDMLVNVRTCNADSTVPAIWRARPYKPDSSYLVYLLYYPPTAEKNLGGTTMPQTGGPLSEAEKQIIIDWIAEGAFRNIDACKEDRQSIQ